jgi:hypothetical protein
MMSKILVCGLLLLGACRAGGRIGPIHGGGGVSSTKSSTTQPVAQSKDAPTPDPSSVAKVADNDK